MSTRNPIVIAVATVAIAVAALTACGESSTAAGPPDPLREGRSIYGDVCSVCHGGRGEGGVGPSLAAVVETWPSCAAHVEWVSLGSDGWRTAHGDTYGAPDKPLKGGMPGQVGQLTDEEIRLVAAFERVEYGGADREATLADCAVRPN